MTIILYDIPSTLPDKAWSPMVWKISLNLKELPYKTEWVEYPDIETHCRSLGIPPTSQKPDGSPFYTLPAIHDPSTGVYISDSVKIAAYLEERYPSGRRIFPTGHAGIQIIFEEVLFENVSPLLALAFPDFVRKMNARSGWFMIEKVEAVGSKNRREDWVKAQEGMGKVAGWYEKNKEKGPFYFGDRISWCFSDDRGEKIARSGGEYVLGMEVAGGIIQESLWSSK
ncbi:Glutathione S-transferase-like protein ustS [Psilocybe cubensis]|uniref:Glutathione S-transferase-like protein ustS n=1 Tax=Psilocybe cubensis TaxID=181762 RepID=A0ACB8GZ13_PSICU|nr:Glutathione S-transferase-like protein ustS [Psilocybe cubensis]KAH9480878.1 Glutathione S-transferase-like protein ustS [Psilocybe cubensis]